MKKILDIYLGSLFEFTNPQGGMFFWGEGPKGLDLTKLYKKAAYEYKVAYVPGEHFYAPGTIKKENTMRLNFSYPTEKQIEQAIKRLTKLFNATL